MQQVKLEAKIVNYPMPVALLGTKKEDKVNFMAIAWFSMASYNPPRLVISLGPHISRKTIIETGVFSLSFPSEEMMKDTDFCGIVSSSAFDKSKLFKTFYGQLDVPLIEKSPLNVECRVSQIVDNGSNFSFFADIVGIYADEKVLNKEGSVDLKKVNPLLLSQNDRLYYSLGSVLGPAWNGRSK
jgi:flavin reductase (DIM6/NTAB) family NADH-FMN oxidoreductase RutF